MSSIRPAFWRAAVVAAISCAVVVPTASAWTAQPYGTAGPTPTGITADANGNAYVANGGERSVTKIAADGTTTQFDFDRAGRGPSAITVDRSGNVFVAARLSATALKITPAGVVTMVGSTSRSPMSIAVDSRRHIFTANVVNGNVTDLAPDGHIRSLARNTLPIPTALAVDAHDHLFVASPESNSVAFVDTTGNEAENYATVPQPVTIAPVAGHEAVVQSGADGSVYRIPDWSSGPKVHGARIGKAGSDPRGIIYEAATGLVYAVSADRGTVAVIPKNGGAASTISTGLAGLAGITMDPSGNLYVVSGQTRQVTKLVREQATLRTTVEGRGSVSVSGPGGAPITCTHDCATAVKEGVTLTVEPTADKGSYFAGWTNACFGDAPKCRAFVGWDRQVTATFKRNPTLSVSLAGTGRGAVTSTSGGIDCGGLFRTSCAAVFPHKAQVTLRASATTGSRFARWEGACGGTAKTCTVTMDEVREATAVFTADPVYLRLSGLRGTGRGTVTAAPGGIVCRTSCTTPVDAFSRLVLTATPDDGSRFVRWESDDSCKEASPTCSVYMNVGRTVDAVWERLPPSAHMLTVARNGDGRVDSVPPGIACGTDCRQEFKVGAVVTLTASPGDRQAFSGWSGACDGLVPTCTVTMDEARTVAAGFTPLPPDAQRLTVTRMGNADGTVTSLSPNTGITCGTDCAQEYPQGTDVTLQAVPGAGARFAGWGGVCTGTAATCTVTMDEARAVSAAFEVVPPDKRLLTVLRGGSGTGTVRSAPAGIACGLDCSQLFTDGTQVTLTASPGDASRFAGWSGACSGDQPTCTVGMDSARRATATFEALPPGSPVITVATDGTGTGAVGSAPPGIDCGTDCRQGFAAGTPVTLTARPGDGAAFGGWTGACAGSDATCTLTPDGDAQVGATFTEEVAIASLSTTVPRTTVTIRSKVRVAGAGRLTQQAVQTGGKRATWCRTAKAVASAGTTSLTCNLGAKGRTALSRKALTLSLRTTFTPSGGRAVITTRPVTVRRRA